LLSKRNKDTEYNKRQDDVRAVLEASNLNKNDIHVASDEREVDLKKLTDDLTNKKRELDQEKQKSDDFKNDIDLINAKIKQYEDELKLVPVPGDRILTAKIAELNTKKAAVEAEKRDVDNAITTLTDAYNVLKIKYSA
jgi:chromosome segregation ATPase